MACSVRRLSLRLGLFGLLSASLLGGCALRSARPEPPSEATALVREGDGAYERMSFEEAWGAYQKARALGSRDAVLFYRLWILGEVLRKKHPAGDARDIRQRAHELLNAAYEKKTARPAVYFYLAQFRNEPNKEDATSETRLYAEAIRRFEAGEFKGLDSGELALMGRMYAFLGLAERAERLYTEALQQEPRNAFAVYGRARLYQQAGRHAEALREWERFVALVPQDPEGYTRLGESAQAAGDWSRALKVFEHAVALDSTNPVARRGFRRAKELSARRDALRNAQDALVWEVGFTTRLSPLTLREDELHLMGEGLGPPVFSSEGTLAFASGGADRFSLYTLTPDGVNLVRRVASAEGFTAFTDGKGSLLVTSGAGPRRSLRTYDLQRGTMQTVFGGSCGQPLYSSTARLLLCADPEGIILREMTAQKTPVVLRGPGSRHPRLGRDGQAVVFSDGGEIVWHYVSGKEIWRVRPGSDNAAAAFPDLSPDGKWVVSGANGLYLTAVMEKITIRLSHLALRGAGRAAFAPDGRSLAFVMDGRLFRLELPEKLEAFAALRWGEELLDNGQFGQAVRFLSARPAAERESSISHLLLGRGYAGMRFYREAEAALQRSAELDARDWRPRLWLGKLRAMQEDWKEAFRRLEQVVQMAPLRFEGYLERARAHASLGRFSEAIADFREAIRRLDPHSGREGEAVVHGLLDAYVRERNFNEALLLLLEHGKHLGENAVKRVRTDPAYLTLRSDPRFREVLGHRFSEAPREAAP